MEGFVEVASVEGFEDQTMRVAEVDGHELLVSRVGDAFFVSDNHCPHLGGRLSKGALKGTVITCHLHHSQFDLRDGRVVRWTSFEGAARTIAEITRHPRPLRVYEVAVEDGRILAGPEKQPVTEAEQPY